jgi:hypothetical protein
MMKYFILLPLALAVVGCSEFDAANCPDTNPTTVEEQDPRCIAYPRLSPADPNSRHWDVGSQEWGLGQEGILDAPGHAWLMGQVWPVTKSYIIDNLGQPKHWTQASLTYKWENRWITVYCEAVASPDASCYTLKEAE